MPQPAPRFSDVDLAAAVDAGEDLHAFAVRVGVRYGLVQSRLRRLRIERGEAVRASGDFTWDDKLKFQPTPAQVEALYRTHGREAVVGRWGRQYGDLRRVKGGALVPRVANR